MNTKGGVGQARDILHIDTRGNQHAGNTKRGQIMETTNLGIIIPKGVENLQLPDDSLLNFYEGLEERVFWINDEINIYFPLNLIHYIMKWNKGG